MVARRTHTKSRRGCVQCKKNRTKCDEKKPSCGRCTRREEHCSFLDRTSSLIVIPAQSRISPNESAEQSDPAHGSVWSPDPATTPGSKRTNPESVSNDSTLLESRFTNSERDHLRLMNHYAHFTCKTMTDLTFGVFSQEGLSIWRDYAPQLAFEHDFLLHGILSVSALHLALIEPSSQQKHALIAIRQHDLGLAQFLPHLTNIVTDKVNALFAFSCITALYSFGIHRTSLYQLTPLAKIHEVFSLLRGTGSIVKTSLHWLQHGPFSPMLLQKHPDEKLSAELENVVDVLSQRVHTTIAASQHSEVYLGAIAALRQNLVQATTRLHSATTFIFFPIMVQPEFFTLLCVGEPLALAILANYAVILYWLTGHIWLEGWGLEVVDAVHKNLPLDWHDCIAWALKETGSSSDEI